MIDCREKFITFKHFLSVFQDINNYFEFLQIGSKYTIMGFCVNLQRSENSLKSFCLNQSEKH